MNRNKKLGIGFNTPFVNVPQEVIVKNSTPTGYNYNIGQIWINNSTSGSNSIYMFTGIERTSSGEIQAIWVNIGNQSSSTPSSSSSSSTPTSTFVLPEKKEEKKGKEKEKEDVK